MATQLEVSNKMVVLKNYVQGSVKESDMEVKTSSIKLQLPDQGSGGVLVKNLWLSCDPYMRTIMVKIKEHYVQSFTPGLALTGLGVAEVVESGHSDFKKGDLVWGMTGWEEYSLITENRLGLFKIHNTDVPPSYYLGILGAVGLTAYVGLYEIGCAKKGDYVFVSAASGAVGHLVGQLAKLSGCYVVGSAGTKQKVEMLKDKLGFDEAFNYKEEPDLDATLKRYFPEGIDIYFENVGGKMLEAVLVNMRNRGRIAVCGFTSEYDVERSEGVHNLKQLILKNIRMEGFVVMEYYHLFEKYMDMVLPLIKDHKIVYLEDVAQGLDAAPGALVGLFNGRNIGKQVIQVANYQ